MSEWLREDGDGNGVADIGDQGWWTQVKLQRVQYAVVGMSQGQVHLTTVQDKLDQRVIK